MKSGFVRRREPPRRNINFFSFSQAHPPLPPLSTSLFLSLPPFLLGLATFLRHHPLSLPSFHEAPPRLSTDRKVFQPEETFQLCLSPSLEIVTEASENLAPSGYPANTGSFFRGGGRYITSACPVSWIKLASFIKRVIDRRLMSPPPNFAFANCLPRRQPLG